MASSSSPPHRSISLMNTPRNNNKYDVFLSFRGEDTRDNFTSHLYYALCQKHIETFIDDQLISGNEITLSLLDVIEASSISVIIFSEGYASSRWCLDELSKILDCKREYAQIVIPVFYRVDPSHVRRQIGIFGDLFWKLVQGFPEKMQRWRKALMEAANLSGFDSQVIRPESRLIEKIANEVLERLDDTFQSENKDLVGVEWPIKETESLLRAGSAGICKLGIWGIGGIGKTTIAGTIFNNISRNFEGSYFAHNVREAEETGGLAHLRLDLLTTLLGVEKVKNFPNMGFNFQSKRLTRQKVLIVFDDVTHLKQIELLIGRLDWFASGSGIIITTRDKQVLSNCQVNQIYEVKELADVDALKLFSRCAFGGDHPDASYTELTRKAIKYAKGVPLALKVLGSCLCGRRKEEWESAMSKLEIVPHMKIQEVLKISYDGLDDSQKNIFLDIACFLEGEVRDQVVSFLDASGFFTEIELSVLVDKSLIIIDHYNKIRMHDLLRDMGREIVRKESIAHPGKRSRLWYHKDIYEVLTKSMGTEAIEGISLDMGKVKSDIHINSSTFSKMPKLRFLRFYGENKCKVSHLGGVPVTEVKYFEWHGYPLKTLNILAENLVSLKMPGSKVEQLWDDVQNLVNLQMIDLENSKQLKKIPDLSLARNLERLHLNGCSSLIEIHSSIKHLNKLKVLYLGDCKSLRRLPYTIHSESLEHIRLMGCSNLKNFPEISSHDLKCLYLDRCGIEELPSSIEYLFQLFSLVVSNCTRLEYIASSIFNLKSLEFIGIYKCSNLKRFPGISSCHIDGAGIEELPSSILELKSCSMYERLPGSLCMSKSLRSVSIIDCPNLRRLPDEIGNLKALEKLRVEGTAIREVPESLGRLSSLELLILTNNRNLERIPESLGRLSSLELLILTNNSNLERIPESIKHLSKLKDLQLSYCERLQTLSELPCNLREIQADHCMSLEALSSISFDSFVDLRNCFKLDRNEVSEIVQDSLQKAKARWRTSYNEERILTRIYFPGNEIPKWFRYQSMGSSIILKTPAPGFFNNKKIMGFAFCAVVELRDYYDSEDSYVECKWKVKPKGCYRDLDICWYVGMIDFVESDHLFLGYNFFNSKKLDYLGKYYEVNEVSLNIRLRFCSRLMCYGEVKKCGIHFLYD